MCSNSGLMLELWILLITFCRTPWRVTRPLQGLSTYTGQQRNRESLPYSHCQKTSTHSMRSWRDSMTDGTPTFSLVNIRCYSTRGLSHTSSKERSQICQKRLWASSYLSLRPSVRIKQLVNSSVCVWGGGGWKSTKKNSSLVKIEQK